MKKLMLIGWLGLATVHVKAGYTKPEDLKVDCSGQLKIEQVIKAKYSPGLPAQGRFPGIPPREYIVTKASIQNMTGKGCSLLDTKYKLDLQKQFDIFVDLKGGISQTHVETVAASLVGTMTSFQVTQSFGFASENGYLPLFPEVVTETIGLQGKTEKTGDSIQATFPIDVASIYGTTPVEQWSEEQKVALAKKLSWHMGTLSAFHDIRDFHQLFLDLEVQSAAAKKTIFQIIWKKFNEASTHSGWYQFSNFEVGGTGAFVGQPFAKKLIALANEVATEEEKKDLLFQFPTLLVPGGFSKTACLNVTIADLHQVMQQWQQMHPTLLISHTGKIERVLELISLPQSADWNFKCVANLQKNGNQEYAKEILQSLGK